MPPVISELICIKQILSRRAIGDDLAVLVSDSNSFSRAITAKKNKYFGGIDKNTYLCIV